jgi:hypothetical protein
MDPHFNSDPKACTHRNILRAEASKLSVAGLVTEVAVDGLKIAGATVVEGVKVGYVAATAGAAAGALFGGAVADAPYVGAPIGAAALGFPGLVSGALIGGLDKANEIKGAACMKLGLIP